MDAKRAALTTVLVLGGFSILVSSCSEDKDDGHGKATVIGHGDGHAASASAHVVAPVTAQATRAAIAAAHGTAAPAHVAQHAAHWAYEGEGGPQNWATLDAKYSACSDGKNQSPIDISPVTITSLSDIEFNYQESPLEIKNNGHTIQVNYAPGSSITVAGKQYELLQYHFHSPSEHTIGGKAYDMVAHLVHKAADGQLGVIGVVFSAGDKVNSAVSKLWLNMPEKAGVTTKVTGVKVNAADLLPVDYTYFNYSGSLTTPPCSEGVNWMVMATPNSVSEAQVEQFTNLFPLSARPVQPLNGRMVRASN